jgi:catechol 2,3-dioxygenase-like lactoylglutathione lyase family enzyme
MLALHHVAICTADLDRSLEFCRGGMGLTIFFDRKFAGDWPALFDAPSHDLRSVFLGDPAAPQAGIVELVQFDETDPTPPATVRPHNGFFLLSFERDVDSTLEAMRGLGFAEDARRIDMPGRVGTVAMATLRAPDNVMIELIGPDR